VSLRGCALVFALGVIGAFTAPAFAHPHHVSRGEASLNAKTGHLEVSLLVPAKDLQRALVAFDGQPVRWKAKTLDARLAKYVADTFRVRTDDGLSRLRFAGWAPSGQRLWLHFEALDVPRLHGVTITHTLLMKVEPSQLNVLKLQSGSYQASLMFDRDHSTRTIDTHASK